MVLDAICEQDGDELAICNRPDTSRGIEYRPAMDVVLIFFKWICPCTKRNHHLDYWNTLCG